MNVLSHEFMREALFAGAMVGVAAPSIGIFLVQRRLSLMGDGIGHVVFMGVAAGLVLGWSPIGTALVFAVAGATTIEILRQRGKTSSDVALALIFYLGIAGGIFFLGFGDSSSLQLNRYLFGSIVTVNDTDLVILSLVTVGTVLTTLVLRKHLFAVAYDEEIARVSGLPVTLLNLVTAVVTAMIVAVTAKVVGVLLVSALLVLPVAAVQQIARSFRTTFYGGMAIGALVTTAGLVIAFYTGHFPAATIVLMSIGLFVAASMTRPLIRAG
jgi:zinc transport system permease protein